MPTYVPLEKRKREDSAHPEEPTTEAVEFWSKKPKLVLTTTKAQTTTTSACTTAWASGNKKASSASSSTATTATATAPNPWGRGAASKILFPASTSLPVKPAAKPVQPVKAVKSVEPAKAWSQGAAAKLLFSTSASLPVEPAAKPVQPVKEVKKVKAIKAIEPAKESSLNPSAQAFIPSPTKPTAWNPNATSFAPATSQSVSSYGALRAWRSKTSTNWRTGPQPPPPQVSRDPIRAGQICRLTKMKADIPQGEPIHLHPDFMHDNAFNCHPCLVIEEADENGYLTCFQATSFSSWLGLDDKYSGPAMREQRKRWLLIESAIQTSHDDLPVLKYDTASASLPKATYICTEKYFKIKPEHLLPPPKAIIKLDLESVDTVKRHHSRHYSSLMSCYIQAIPGMV